MLHVRTRAAGLASGLTVLVVAAVLAFVGAALALLLVRRRDFVTAPVTAPAEAAA